MKSKTCNSAAVSTVLKESPATAYIDGQNRLEPVVRNFCMDIGIKKAKEWGVGWVVSKGHILTKCMECSILNQIANACILKQS